MFPARHAPTDHATARRNASRADASSSGAAADTAAPAKAAPLSTSLRPIDPKRFGYQQARHLLSRAGFGGTPEQIRQLAEWGPEKAVDSLLDFGNAGDDGETTTWDDEIIRPLTERERAVLRAARQNQDEDTIARFRERQEQQQRSDREQLARAQQWWLGRMIRTTAPLREKLTLFWHGHFASSYRTVENSYHMLMQNRLFRSQAAGSFARLLRGIVRDPAMLRYLDNHINRRDAINENLARELMELFSLGEGNAYTERDIREAARCLTGYTYEGNAFVFRQDWHDTGAKTLFGKTDAYDGDSLVERILAQPVCAEYIAWRLYEFFVRDLPERTHPHYRATTEVVRRLGTTLRSARYELRPMLRKLLLSEHFYEPALAREKIKSPVELAVGAIRTLQTPVRDLGAIAQAMDLMGQSIFYPPTVAGWAGGRTWINTSTLFARQNLLSYLLTGTPMPGLRHGGSDEPYDPTPVLAELARVDPGAERDPARAIPFLLRFMLGGEPTAEHTRQLVGFVERHGGRMTPPVTLATMALITTLPEYQLC